MFGLQERTHEESLFPQHGFWWGLTPTYQEGEARFVLSVVVYKPPTIVPSEPLPTKISMNFYFHEEIVYMGSQTRVQRTRFWRTLVYNLLLLLSRIYSVYTTQRIETFLLWTKQATTSAPIGRGKNTHIMLINTYTNILGDPHLVQTDKTTTTQELQQEIVDPSKYFTQ